MSSNQNKQTYLKTLNITAAFLAAVMFVLFPACSGKDKKLTEAISENDTLPSMKSLGVTTLISDSGITRYKIVAEEWLIYDKKNPPYWAFEKGVYLEKFDTLFRIDASIKADTAYYHEKKKLWELKGHVQILSQRGDKFQTDLLFWDEKKEKVYSDKDHLSEGHHFRKVVFVIEKVENHIICCRKKNGFNSRFDKTKGAFCFAC